MFKKVIATCSDFPELVVLNPGFVQSIGKLQQIVAEIEQLSDNQAAYNTRLTPGVQALYDRLTEVALAISGALYVYAAGTGDQSLKTRANLRPSDFKRITQKKCIEECTLLLEEARKQSFILSDFGVTSEALLEFEKLLVEYKNLHTRPREMMVSRTRVTQVLEKTLIKGNRLLKEESDRLARYYKLNAPRFYEAYTGARKGGIPAVENIRKVRFAGE